MISTGLSKQAGVERMTRSNKLSGRFEFMRDDQDKFVGKIVHEVEVPARFEGETVGYEEKEIIFAGAGAFTRFTAHIKSLLRDYANKGK